MKNNMNLYNLTFFFLSVASFAQTITYPINNQNAYNTSFAPIEDTYDGGHLINYPFGSSDGQNSTLLIKTDSEFVPIWSKYFVTHYNGKKVLTYPDGTSILFASVGCWMAPTSPTQSSWFCGGFKLHKLDNQGQAIWSKSIWGSDNNNYITPYDAFIKDANTIKIAGKYKQGNAKPVVTNFDLEGNFIQGTVLQGLDGRSINSFCKEESTGNYYALIDDHIAKFSQDDVLIWIKKLNPENPSAWFSFGSGGTLTLNIKVLNNGDLLVSRPILMGISPAPILLMRINPTGNMIWSKKVSNCVLHGIKESASGEIVLSIIESNRSYVLKLTADGSLIWSKGFMNSTSISELYEKSPNEWYFAVKGYSPGNPNYNQPVVFSIDNSGNSPCVGFDANKTLSDENISLITPPTTITQMPLGALHHTTDSPSLLIELGGQTSTTECVQLDITDFTDNNISLYPNPNTGNFTVKSNAIIEKVEVFTLLGQKIDEFNPNLMDFSIFLKDSGIYIVKLNTINETKMVKVVVAK
ncbi:MAG: T9SS type A sorting domain-containing protein [Flavobacterium sp.]